jgi:Ser/Thr protein kinase RdoA (MazF antagonist)
MGEVGRHELTKVDERRVAMSTLTDHHVSGLLRAFGLGKRGRLSDGPVADGRMGSIWRLDTDDGSFAVKQVRGDADPADIDASIEGARFQEAAVAAGIPAPLVHRTRTGVAIADLGDVRATLQTWVDLDGPDLTLDPAAVGGLVGRLHRVQFEGTAGLDPWYTAPVGPASWHELTRALRARRAPFAAELDALIPELIALEGLLGSPPRFLRTCHRDLWADNLRMTTSGGLCVIDFDNAGMADPSQELALVLVEFGGADPRRAAKIREAYADAGGPGRVQAPTDFAMPIAQLGHIVEEGCRRWLVATSDADRADNEAWVREYLDRPLTRAVIETLLPAQP